MIKRSKEIIFDIIILIAIFLFVLFLTDWIELKTRGVWHTKKSNQKVGSCSIVKSVKRKHLIKGASVIQNQKTIVSI